MATTLREALEIRKVAQDAMTLGARARTIRQIGGSVAHQTMGNDPGDHHDAIRYHSFHVEHLADRADRAKSPKLKEKYGKLSDAHADLAQVHLDLARRKQGIIPTVKAKGSIPSAKPKG